MDSTLGTLVIVEATATSTTEITVTPSAPVSTTAPLDDSGQSTSSDALGATTESSLPDGGLLNHTFPVRCLGTGQPEITLVDGEQVAAPDNEMIYARLASTEDVGGGKTLAMIECVISVEQFGYVAVLLDEQGGVLDRLGIPSVESTDGSIVAVSSREGWETGTHPDDAASVQLYELSIEGQNIELVEGEVKPKCAAMGTQDAGRSDGAETNEQGMLVHQLHVLLNDEGHGKQIGEEELAGSIFGDGTVAAFSEYFRDNFDVANRAEPAPWFGKDDAEEIYWIDIGWVEVLDLDCYGEYRPTEPNESP